MSSYYLPNLLQVRRMGHITTHEEARWAWFKIYAVSSFDGEVEAICRTANYMILELVAIQLSALREIVNMTQDS